ncbi:MAG: hypothetical protein J6Y37_18490 [Paludibacteraceae bacterium]|nr:hypothetical protein [Paludibacteraceae bacterium]
MSWIFKKSLSRKAVIKRQIRLLEKRYKKAASKPWSNKSELVEIDNLLQAKLTELENIYQA